MKRQTDGDASWQDRGCQQMVIVTRLKAPAVLSTSICNPFAVAPGNPVRPGAITALAQSVTAGEIEAEPEKLQPSASPVV